MRSSQIDPVDVLRRHQHDPQLGAIAMQALQFIGDSPYKILHTPGPGESSLSIARIWEIRRSLKGFKHDAFVGLEESITCLRARDVSIELVAMEMVQGIVSLWLRDESQPPRAIMIMKFAT